LKLLLGGKGTKFKKSKHIAKNKNCPSTSLQQLAINQPITQGFRVGFLTAQSHIWRGFAKNHAGA
jgi:hypothetical protein